MTAKLKPLKVSSFTLGINTRRPDYKLKNDKPPYGSFMREIVNADISDDGALKRRRGYTKVLNATLGGSLWSNSSQAYYANGTSLMSLTDTNGVLGQTAVTGAALVSGAPVSFCLAPMGGAYWTDGATLGYVQNGVSAPVAPPQPTVLPTVSLGAGLLDAGIYSICFSYVDSAGRESGAYGPITQVVPANGALTFTLATEPAYTLNVYVSLPNGIEVYRALQFAASGTQTLTTLSAVGPTCTTVGLTNMPPGRFVRYNNGRLMVVADTFLYYSKPYMSGLYDQTSDYIAFPNGVPISVIEIIAGEGVFVVSDQTYWLEGDIAEAEAKVKQQFGAVPGSSFNRPDSRGCFWMSARGICVGDEGGVVKLIQDENVQINLTKQGASLMADRDGSIQLITVLYGGFQSPISEGSKYLSAEFTDNVISGETWVAHDDEGATWHYTNYAFVGFAPIAARYYGVRADGIYLLEGDTDAGAPINFSLNPGRQNFGTEQRKRMEAAYMTVSSTDVMHLTITDDRGNSYTYDTRRSDGTMMTQRIDVGRGLTGNFLGFSITNENGCAFEMQGFELVAVETARRIQG